VVHIDPFQICTLDPYRGYHWGQFRPTRPDRLWQMKKEQIAIWFQQEAEKLSATSWLTARSRQMKD
jgi:hypothetical protein